MASRDLSELASQTELFAQKHGKLGSSSSKPLTGHGPTADPPPTTRSSSYSSVVSNGSTTAEPPRVKTTKVATDLSNKKPGLFPIESGATGNNSPTLTSCGLAQNPWTGQLSPDLTTPPSTFLLQPIQEAQPTSLADDNLQPTFTPTSGAAGGFGLSDASGMGGFPLTGGFPDLNNMTIMQRLQADRRKRLMDYQQKLSEEWPGFNLPLSTQTESLWDNAMGQNEAPWSTLTNSPPRPQAAAMLWDSPLNAAAPSGWTANTGLWTDSALDGGASGPEPLNPPPPGGAVGNFDPFNTLGNIWKPSSSVASDHTVWGFPPKPDDED